jgi:hypothetical protein
MFHKTTGVSGPRARVWLVGIGLVTLLAGSLVFAASLLIYRSHIAEKNQLAEARQKALEVEFRAMEQPTWSVPTQRDSIYKSDHGNIAVYYKTDRNYREIRAYYDRELEKQGWTFRREKELTTWGRQRGEWMAFYCKGQTSAEIYYTGEEETALGYRYSLSLSWELYQC